MKFCVFDAYGTLFDVNAPARKITKEKSVVTFVYVNTVKSKVYEVIDNNKFNVKPNTPII